MKKVYVFITAAVLMAALAVGVWMYLTSNQPEVVDDEPTCSCPHTTLYLQPMGDFTEAEAQKLKAEIEEHRRDFGYALKQEIVVLPNRPLTNELLNDAKTRYSAGRILDDLKKVLKNGCTVIGLAHKDIATSNGDIPDWGVMGLSLISNRVGVVSTFRVRNKADLWKVVAHEFCHAFWGFDHCTSGDTHCILQDAKGKYIFGHTTGLCETCMNKTR